MTVRRTVPVKLDVDSDDAALLEDTVDTFLWSAQYVVDHAFEGEYVTTSKTTLDDETYDDVREAFQRGRDNRGRTALHERQLDASHPLQDGRGA